MRNFVTVFLACFLLHALALSAPNLIGMNMPTPLDWDNSKVFADAFRTARDWEKISGGTAGKDANGWPTQDAQVVCWHGATNMAGTYKLEFNGKGDVTFPWGGATLSNKTYDATSDTTRAFINVTADSQLMLRFSNTSNGVRNVRLWRPGYHAGTNTFTREFLAHLHRYQVLRFMDWLATNWNKDQRWSDRLLPHQHSAGMNKPGYGWQGRGTALELAVQLCNEAQKDMWVCIPGRADDNYVTNFALVIRDGANGYPGLATNLKVYVEYANELWNTMFSQTFDNYAMATQEAAQANSPLRYDGGGGDWYWAWRRIAKRGVEISQIFRHVFGDAAMMTRIRPVLMTQADNGQATLSEALGILEGHYNNPERVAVPRPANYYFYGAGGANYYSPDNESDTLTLDNIWNSERFNVANMTNILINDARYVLSFGLQRICYEGGPGLDKTGHSEAVKAAAVNDPRMRAKVVEHHDAWSRFGGGLFVYFSLVGDYQWGFTHYVGVTNTPKLQAIDDLNAAPAAATEYGILLPATNDGRRFSCYYIGWQQPGSGSWDIPKLHWAGYVTRVSLPGPYRYTVRAGAATPSSFEFFIDGNSYGTFSVPPVGLANVTNVVIGTVLHSPGNHSFRITSRSGTNRIHHVVVDFIPEPGSIFALLIPIALREWLIS
ncbi:MAG: hypothetical protein N2595_03970 [bacterium]|nr:hypothetical protein [bacterium]